MKTIFKLLRVKHYLKNFLIFLPLIFSGMFFNKNLLIQTVVAFVSFSLAASIVYIINDIRDKDKDKLHPIKKERPIASGKVSIKQAIIIAIILIIFVLIINIFFLKNYISLILIGIYIFINILYSFGLKNYPLIDIAILVTGFLLRVIYGATIIDIEVSNWLYMTILAVSFYLSLGKRRNEMIKNGSKSRVVLKYYTKDFLDKNMYMCLGLAVTFYSLWCNDVSLVQNKMFILSIPIVLILCMRYNMIIEGNSYGDPVDVILSDKMILGISVIYLVFMMACLYIPF